MSHFTVLVVGENPEAQLLPYHEFECTGENNEYVQEIDKTEEATANYETSEKDMPLSDFIVDYYGYKKVFKESDIDIEGEHKYGYVLCAIDGSVIKAIDRTNPNKKWDWYTLGGRWSNHLLLKNGTHADYSLKRDIDFKGMRDANEISELSDYDFIQSKIAGMPIPESWESVRSRISDIDNARSFYNEQALVKRCNESDIRDKIGFFGDINKYLVSREDFAKRARNSAVSTFALIMNGKWYEKGHMGWFAIVSDEKSDWDEEFNKLIDSISDDTLLSVYDCHI